MIQGIELKIECQSEEWWRVGGSGARVGHVRCVWVRLESEGGFGRYILW